MGLDVAELTEFDKQHIRNWLLRPVRAKIEKQGELVKVRMLDVYNGSQRPPRSSRGVIASFSDKSRKRMLEMFARLDRQKIKDMCRRRRRPLFVTLTYEENMTDAARAKRDLDTFIKRLVRIEDTVSVVWRMEFQERGAIHFHLMVFGLPFTPIQDKKMPSGRTVKGLQTHWNEVVGQSATNSLDFELMKSLNGVMYYVSKYMSKEQDEPDNNHTAASHYQHSSHVYETYLTPRAPVGLSVCHISPPPVGRFWGVYGRANMPFAEKSQFDVLITMETMVYWCAFINHPWAIPTKSFTLFTNRAQNIIDMFDYVWMQHMENNAAIRQNYIWSRNFVHNSRYRSALVSRGVGDVNLFAYVLRGDQRKVNVWTGARSSMVPVDRLFTSMTTEELLDPGHSLI